MGNILSKVKSSRKVEKVEDRLGGFQIRPTAIYDAIVNKMYTFKSSGGALAVVLEAGLFLDPNTDEETRFTQTFYVTNGEGENFYTDSKGKERMNNSWVLVDALAMFATEGEAGLGELETEEFTIKRKDESGKEVQEIVDSFPEVEGLEIKLALMHVNKPKSQKVDGKWKEIPDEFVEENTVDRIFDQDGFTILEWQAELAEPEFIHKWEKQWKGKVKQIKHKPVTATSRTGGTGRTGASTSARTLSRGASGTGRPSCFGPK